MKKTIAVIAAAALAGSAMAGNEIIVDLTGIESWDDQGDPDNVVLSIDLGVPGAEVTGMEWDLGFTPFSPSWTEEPHITLSDTDQTDMYDWDMGDWGGTSNSDPIDLAGSDSFSLFVGDDGMLRIEFWEDFVDFSDGPDGFYDRGTLNISFVPAPGAIALLGLAGFAAPRRRRH